MIPFLKKLFRKTPSANGIWDVPRKNGATFLVGDTGSGVRNNLTVVARRAINERKTVLLFSFQGDASFYGETYNAAHLAGMASQHVLNSYDFQASPNSQGYQHPNWDDVLVGGGSVVTVFPPLSHGSSVCIDLTENIFEEFFLAMDKCGQNTLKNTVILIDDATHLKESTLLRLNSFVSQGTEIILTVKSYFFSSNRASLSINNQFMFIGKCNFNNWEPFLRLHGIHASIDAVRQLIPGKGFEVDFLSRQLKPVLFPFPSRIPF